MLCNGVGEIAVRREEKNMGVRQANLNLFFYEFILLRSF